MSAEPAGANGTTLAELSQAWQGFGCAVCGQITRPNADPGFRIELHHLLPRSRGGTDDPTNLMGLCGELLPNKCHWRVTTNRMAIEKKAVGWVWRDTRTGDTGLCRPLVLSLAAETGLDRVLTAPIEMRKDRSVSKRHVPQERAEAIAKAEGFDPSDISMPGVEGAERRFAMARELNHRAERAWMVMAVVIQKGMMMGDPKTLGFEDYKEWGDAIGVSTVLMSKLRMIGKQFAGSWEMLPEADKAMLSMEGLYIAARMVKLGRWTEEEALHEAVAQPVHRLWHAYKVEEEEFQGERGTHACPDCGHWHTVHAERNTSMHEHRHDRPHRRKELEPPVE